MRGGGVARLITVTPKNQADIAAAMPKGQEHSGGCGTHSSMLGLEGHASLTSAPVSWAKTSHVAPLTHESTGRATRPHVPVFL